MFRRIILTPFLEERIYNQIASNKKGVVGNTGTNMPTTPRQTKKEASMMYKFLTIFIIFAKIRLNLT